MTAPIIYKDVADDTNISGELFAGKRFWLAQRIPLRNRFKAEIEANGGQVIALEKNADYCIADHCRRDCPPGSISYTFIDQSLKDGEIADPQDHPAGPPVGSVRPPGSVSQAPKSGRVAYTAEEDRILYKWVRDHEKIGGAVAGNELYKQLQQKYPRHPWQSWRERYLRVLRNKPPVDSDIPGNTPPPSQSEKPSEQAASRAPERAPTSPKRKSKTAQSRSPDRNEDTEDQTTQKSKNYTVDELEAVFDTADFIQLYENVSLILENDTRETWSAWAAADEGNRSLEQWIQYFNKVVVPRAERGQSIEKAQKEDNPVEPLEEEREHSEPEPVIPKSEHERPVQKSLFNEESFEKLVKKTVARRQGEKKAIRAVEFFLQVQRSNQSDDSSMSGPEEEKAAIYQRILKEWATISDQEKRPYLAMEAADSERVKREKLENQHENPLLGKQIKSESGRTSPPAERSSSNLVQKTPSYITSAYEKTLKRIRVQDDLTEEQVQTSRSPKRRRSEEQGSDMRLNKQPIELSLRENSSSSAKEDSYTAAENRHQNDSPGRSQEMQGSMEDIIQSDLQAQTSTDGELEDADIPTPIIKGEPSMSPRFSQPNELPSNTSTPKASRTNRSVFDTQAILSSPAVDLYLGALPLPRRDRTPATENDNMSREPTPSTTHSIQEFRRSLNNIVETSQIPTLYPLEPLPLPQSHSPTPSESSSQDSGDPDPPLDVEEIEDFFALQHELGFTTYEIRQALMHTRNRPMLAEKVLEAWKANKSLPKERGIWSESDDEDVDSGDGIALARLEKKHTLDGWGGITERTYFLAQWRDGD
ncbi:hypothetical protein B0J11DRAFT_570176 [Dendryphion nanum]|uniref:DNA-binding protein RAP1 n=1 Tax=Dendryphion nanum TaxID=256645 RepID=A0A9P9DIC2_9PLEO|nr:hypothetical protein B0J11DRAFT_570176 [Dendryphion nanum]